MKNTILLAICIAGNAVLFSQKAFDEYLVNKDFVPFVSYSDQILPVANIDATIMINAGNEVNEVRQSIFGQNAVGWQGNIDVSADREQHWKNANFSLLRYPGGNWSNCFFWDGNIPATILNESALDGKVSNLKSGTTAWMLETDEFPDLLTHTGADGIVCVNVGYAFYGTSTDPVSTAADYAAAWVNEYNIVQGLDVKYWELGNENYGPWQAGFDLATPQKYGEACVLFAQKMKAIDSTIQIGIVLYEGEGGFNNTPQAINWNETVLPIVEDVADFLIIHHYPHPNTNQNEISESAIYDAIDVVEESMVMLDDQITAYTSKPAGYYPIATTEFNMRAGIRNMSRTNTLFTTMMLAEYAKHNYGAVTQWDLQNGFNTETGDHGLVSSRDPFLDEGSVNPEFYAFYYMDKYFGDKIVGSNSDDTDVITYATTFNTGELGVIVINRGASDKVVGLSLNGFNTGNRMYWHTVDGDDSDFDRTVYINGVGPGKTFVEGQSYTSNKGVNDNTQIATAYEVNGVSGPQNYATIDPYSILIPGGVVKFDAPKYSVSYIVFEGSGTGCLSPDLGVDIELCEETSVTLDGTVATSGASYSWGKDGVALATSETFLATSAGVYSVEVQVTGCPTVSDEVIVSSSLLDVQDDTLCVSGDMADLKVLSFGDFHWYDRATNGVELEVGNTYNPIITETDTFYVQNNVELAQVFGKSDIDGNTYGNAGASTVYENANRTTVLTVEQEFTLASVTVFLESSSVDLVLNITGVGFSKTLVFNGLVNANDGGKILVIDEVLAPGIYTLDLEGTVGGVKIQYDNAGNQSLAEYASFETGGGNATWYGMFFDFVLSTSNSCSRTPVVAVYNPQPGCITSIEHSNLVGLDVFPNPTSGQVNFSESIEFEVYDTLGELLHKGNAGLVDLSTYQNGVYVLKTSKGAMRIMKK